MINRALLVGVNHYDYLQDLRYAEQDAKAFAESLKKNYDFRDDQIVLMTPNSAPSRTPSQTNILRVLGELLKESIATKIDLLTIGFFVHGYAKGETRYLCVPETSNVDSKLESTALPLDLVMNFVRRIRARSTIVTLDCCRRDGSRAAGDSANVFAASSERAWLSSRGKLDDVCQGLDRNSRDALLERESEPEFFSLAVLNACSDGQLSYEWPEYEHGVFSKFLLDAFDQKLGAANDCFNYVVSEMQNYPNKPWGAQHPYIYQEGSDCARLIPGAAPTWSRTGRTEHAEIRTRETPVFDLNAWAIPEDSARYEKGELRTFAVCGAEYRFRWIPDGEFVFGGVKDGVDVDFERGFWMMETPVTQKMWTALIGNNPSWFSEKGKGRGKIVGPDGKTLNTDDFPVECVDWERIKLYLLVLQSHLGFPQDLELRLPTEIEFEYASGAGQFMAYAGTNTINEVAWYKGNSGERTHGVNDSEKKSNDWGLRGLTGNVREICVDPDSNEPVCTRGGAWNDEKRECRAVNRAELPEEGRANNVGFRLVFAKKAVKPVVEEPPKPKNPWAEDAKRKAGTVETLSLGGIKYPFHWCPAGTFMMGSNNGDSDEKPVHEVRLTRGFWLLETPVTQRMWQSIMGNNPSNFIGDDRPVEKVKWTDCEQFFGKITEKYRKENPNGPQLKFWFPTEAQWEYACRAGENYDYSGSNNLDSVGWYSKNSGGETHEVRGKAPNGWGFYDMSGNVWEWNADGKRDYTSGTVTDPEGPTNSGSDRVYRGGSWSNDASYCRCACRSCSDPEGSWDFVGFRLLLESVQ